MWGFVKKLLLLVCLILRRALGLPFSAKSSCKKWGRARVTGFRDLDVESNTSRHCSLNFVSGGKAGRSAGFPRTLHSVISQSRKEAHTYLEH